MDTLSRFAEIKFLLAKNGFRSNRWPELLDSPKRPDGFLRVIVHEDDHRVQLVRFTLHEVIMWELDLSMSLPPAIFDAALNAAFAECGVKPRTYRTKLNGREVRVTVPE